MSKIKVLVVDDSAFMRKSISIMVESDKDIEVIATARDGEEGYNLAKTLKPDIITLDIEMPKMDGLTALKKIMKDCPTSVLMVSSLTSEGAEATLKALEYGAVDFIPKELSYVNVNIIKVKEDLIRKIKEIVRHKQLKEGLNRLRRIKGDEPSQLFVQKDIPKIGFRAIALGVSTGGPLSLQKVIPLISKKINVPMFIVQHMPPKFTKSLSDRLNGMSELEVKEAEPNEPVRNNVVYIAPGGFHIGLRKNSMGNVTVDISENPNTTLHRPSVDVMMESVINVYGKYTLGIIMTGMGKDGLEGIKMLKNLGGYCIAQNAESCIVYGMPKAVVDYGCADIVSSLEKIAEVINKVLIR
ncbi:MAG: chemotaxis response regulator protein-glutamate methylesterase [Ignavibacteriaceae bacterium]|jgi:two-component system chemotaxis response regulator CheB|nr:chemotaxis response regulator protein-glutamate methylesterase [Ignavibacteriaceae bacterium]